VPAASLVDGSCRVAYWPTASLYGIASELMNAPITIRTPASVRLLPRIFRHSRIDLWSVQDA